MDELPQEIIEGFPPMRYVFSGEWSEQTIGSRNTALRNRKKVWYPIYICEETNGVIAVASLRRFEPPNTASS
jgi:hypothetical protein